MKGLGASRWLWTSLVIPSWPASIPDPRLPTDLTDQYISQVQSLALASVSSFLRLLSILPSASFQQTPPAHASCESQYRGEYNQTALCPFGNWQSRPQSLETMHTLAGGAGRP